MPLSLSQDSQNPFTNPTVAGKQMPTKISQSSASTVMSSFKLVLISTSVLSAAIMLRLSAPAIADFAECLPSIYNGVVSWLRPPYLYLVINFIIVTILASSKLQSKKEEGDVSVSPAAQPLDTMNIVHPHPVSAAALPVKNIQPDYPTAEYNYNGVVFGDPSGYEVKPEKELEFGIAKSIQMDYPTAEYNYNGVVFVDPSGYGVKADEELELGIDTCDERVDENKVDSSVIIVSRGAFAADVTSNKENEYVVAKSTWSFVPENIGGLTAKSPGNLKPPVSARFSHRRNVKASPEGVRTVLGVSKPKKQDTLESTWRTITEGRAMPVTRHLKKSDTWERDNHRVSRQQEKNPPQKLMKKAETFNDRMNTRSTSPGGSSDGGGSEKLRRDASLGHDELNRRVEAFIKKFNEEMRMQRQESLNQYKEMVN